MRVLCMALVFLCATAAQAAWYWPFDPDSTNKPPRLHRLLAKANDYIELAEDESLEGNGDKAIENYRLALKELDRVEMENPDRADTPEFAPLRTKRATCLSAIESIRFAQVNDNERAVQVTNTSELQKKWNRKHGIKTPGDEADKKEDAAGLDQLAAKPVEDEAFRAAYAAAMASVRNKDYVAAERQLAALEKDHATSLKVLLLRSAVEVGLGRDLAARRTLEKATTLHRSYLPFYNLANLALKIDSGDIEGARRYYEKGRALGGPANAALEDLLK